MGWEGGAVPGGGRLPGDLEFRELETWREINQTGGLRTPGWGVGLAAVIFLRRMGWGLSAVLLQRLADEGKRLVLIGAG